MPSFRDAIEVFREASPTSEDIFFRVQAKRWFHQNNQDVSLIGLQFETDPPYFVWMQSSATIHARNTLGERDAYPAHLFNNAVGDGDGNIQLEWGEYLHACEVIGCTILKWAPKKTRVVNAAINFMEAQERCFRMLGRCDPNDPNSFKIIPAVHGAPNMFIDYMAVRELRMEDEKFDAFLAYYEEHTRPAKPLSRQTIARILSDAGMRIPQRKAAA